VTEELEQYSNPLYLDLMSCCTRDDSEYEISQQALKGIVVDIGCGEGPFLPFMKGFTEYLGIEPIDFQRREAEKLAKQLGLNNCRFLPGTAQNLPIADNSADTIMTTYALSELTTIEDFKKALQEILRIAKDQTKLIICDHIGGINDDYWHILRLAEAARKGRMIAIETPDLWIEIFCFLNQHAEIRKTKRLKIVFEFKDLEDSLLKLRGMVPDIKSNPQVRENVKKFLTIPRIETQVFFVEAIINKAG